MPSSDPGLNYMEIIALLERFRKYLEHKRYSENTIRSYSEVLKQFLGRVRKQPNAITQQDLIDYNQQLYRKQYSLSYQNQITSALKLFFSCVLNRHIVLEKMERPRRQYRLPSVLSKEEIGKLIGSTGNLKHRSMLSLAYGCGLRRSELLNLRPRDIDSNRGLLHIRMAKGNKDRVVPISERTIDMLRQYYKTYRPTTWLFEGQTKGSKYSERSIQQVLKHALRKSGIKKPATLHWLRHSYATHLLESGTQIRYIQELLGHKHSKTTEIYTHVSNTSIRKIKSPLDSLDI